MKKVAPLQNIKKIYFYDSLSKSQTNLTEFNHLINERLKLHRLIETLYDNTPIKDFNSNEEDILSHFYTRMIYAQSYNSFIMFVGNETALFKRRLNNFKDQEIYEFFLKTFSRLENLDTVNKIIPFNVELGELNSKIKFTEGYKVHFTLVNEFVALRKFKLEKGFVQLSEECYKLILVHIFRKHLEKKTYELYVNYLNNPDNRLSNIYNRIIVSASSVCFDSTNISEVLKLMPPCIYSIVKQAKTNNHLKYWDRQFLIRFFKQVNVPVDDCISFFRSTFKVSPEVFRKEYVYSIRHNYGLEGKRANYTAYSCKKIISLSNTPNCSGCAFKKPLHLKSYFEDFNVQSTDIEDLILEEKYQFACAKVLEKIVNTEVKEPLYSPVDFYKIVSENKGEKASKNSNSVVDQE